MYDAIIIGAGVIGCAIARRLGKYEGRYCVIERAEDVSCGASKANSGIVHAGFDAEPGSEKARLNVKGAKMMQELCAELSVPYGKPGALVLAFTQDERASIDKLYRQAIENGVTGCKILDRDEILAMEKNVSPDVLCALYAKDSGLVSPYELTCALADSAAENGSEFIFDTEARDLHYEGGAWTVKTDKGDYRTRAVINCAGVGAERLHNGISSRKIRIIPRKGEYYLIDHTQTLPFTATIFQAPGKMGKGVLVTPTTHGNLLLGPSAEDVSDGQDVATTRAGLDFVMGKARVSWKEASARGVITTFAGVRAHEESGDFVIGAVEGAPEGAFEAVGIESPGLSSAPAIGEEMGDWAATWLGLAPRENYVKPTPLPKPFSAMTDEERQKAYERDPAYGRLVCRCEQVTEAEIRCAIRRPVGARSVDAVKRRTRAGMGRCQGGFCSPRVLEILCEELNIDPLEVTKCGGESRLLACSLSQMAQEARADGE